MAIALENIDKVIDIIKNSKDTNEAKDKLIKFGWKIPEDKFINQFIKNDNNQSIVEKNKFKLSETQAKSILEIKLSRLTSLERDKLIEEYNKILAPTLPLSRHIFQAPTQFYKTGIVFLAYLNGHQDHFLVIGGQEGARSTLHLAILFRLADKAGLFHDPERSARRMKNVMKVHGVGV